VKRFPILVKGCKVFFEVNLIGYKNAGESIVLFVKDESNQPLWCGVIDCYEYKNHNKTKLLLLENGYGNKKNIDFICISHPDLDHIKSISSIIENFCSEKTMFLLPNFFDSKVIQTKEIIKIKETLNEILSPSYSRTKVINNLFFNQRINISDLKWEFAVGTKTICMQIDSLTPFDSVMFNALKVNYQQFKNDFSICLKLTLNDYCYLFMGDCTDIVLKELDECYIPEQLIYLKIPHHGCKNEMMEYYVRNVISDIYVAGCAYRKNTTLKETLDFYKDNSFIVSVTGSVDHSKNIKSYGYVKHVYDILSGECVDSKCDSDGNAVPVY